MQLRSCLCVFVCACVSCLHAYDPVRGVFVANADTGRVVYSYNADKQTQPASLTKMMTLLLTFRNLQCGKLKWTTPVTVSSHAAAQSPTKLGLNAGASITVRDAVLALITKSANDMAVALAEHIGGTEANFIKMMNAEAKRLGMYATHFVNPSGWKNVRQCTTARDMFKLSRALLKEYPKYYALFATKSFSYNNVSMPNHNKLLGRHDINKGSGYFVVDGIKTGYVAASGFNLAASATDGHIRLIAVVLGGATADQRDKHVNLLFQKGFLRARAQLAKPGSRMQKIAAGNSERAYLHQVGVFQPATCAVQAKHVRTKQASRLSHRNDVRVKSRPTVSARKNNSEKLAEAQLGENKLKLTYGIRKILEKSNRAYKKKKSK